MIHYYNIHNLIKISVEDDRHFQKINKLLSYFLTDEIEDRDLDIVIRVRNFKPKLDNYRLVHKKFFIGEHSIFCKSSHKISFWKVWIKNLESYKTEVFFHGDPFFSRELLVKFIIEPIIQYKLSKKEVLFLHSSSVSIKGKGFLFSAIGGIGKTKTMLNLLKLSESKFLSDDFSIINKNTLVSYPGPIGLHEYMVDSCNIKLNRYDSLQVWLRSFLKTITFQYGNIPYLIDVNKVINTKIGDRAKLDAIFVLRKSQRLMLKCISAEEVFTEIMDNNVNTHHYLNEYLMAYSCIYPTFDFWENFRRILTKTLCSGADNLYVLYLSKKFCFTELFNILSLELKLRLS